MSMCSERTVIHILTYNNALSVEGCVRSVLAQTGIEAADIELWISDNNSTDGTVEILRSISERWPKIRITLHQGNTGFCAGHNAAITRFLAGDAEYFLVLNPDIALTPTCIAKLRASLKQHHLNGSASPKLLRCDEGLHPVFPAQIDAAGMRLTRELRHLDRGSAEQDRGQFDRAGFVFGGTGACLLLRRTFIQDMLLPKTRFDAALGQIFPDTLEGLATRGQLFDEAFFAYREDADLAWRSQRCGWRCAYAPHAVAFHTRKVVPERRELLPQSLNRHSVRNRFLLQLNHYSPLSAWGAFIEGFLVRNCLVLAGVLLKEHSSLGALRELVYLFPRALILRRYLRTRATDSVGAWFNKELE